MHQFPIRPMALAAVVALAALACDRADDNPSRSPSPLSQTTPPGTPSDARRGDTAAAPGPLASTTGPAASPATAPPAGSTTPADALPSGMGNVAGAGGRPGAEPPPPSGAAGVSGASAGPVSGSDRAFVSEAANNSLAEIEAGRLVAAKSDNPGVKSLAQHMERDHASANDELKRIAGDKGVNLPNTVAGEPRGQLSRLTTLSTGEMEQAFIRDFGIDAHQKAIALFERQAREGQDPELRAFAERTLPKLREHLAMAQQLQSGRGRP